MFSLQQSTCMCVATSKNNEKLGNGGETRLGVSLFFEINTSNEALDMLDPKLRSALYERAANDSQEDLTGHLPVPKFKFEKPIDWPYVGEGYQLKVHAELGFSKDYVINDNKFDKIKITPKEDGIVGLKFRVYCHPDEKDAGSLLALERHNAVVTLLPPAVSDTHCDDNEIEEESPQRDMLDDEPEKAQSALYVRAVAAVRATKNPTVSALQTEFKISMNEALQLLMEMEENGVIEKYDDEYVVVDEETIA